MYSLLYSLDRPVSLNATQRSTVLRKEKRQGSTLILKMRVILPRSHSHTFPFIFLLLHVVSLSIGLAFALVSSPTHSFIPIILLSLVSCSSLHLLLSISLLHSLFSICLSLHSLLACSCTHICIYLFFSLPLALTSESCCYPIFRCALIPKPESTTTKIAHAPLRPGPFTIVFGRVDKVTWCSRG